MGESPGRRLHMCVSMTLSGAGIYSVNQPATYERVGCVGQDLIIVYAWTSMTGRYVTH